MGAGLTNGCVQAEDCWSQPLALESLYQNSFSLNVAMLPTVPGKPSCCTLLQMLGQP